MLKSGWLLALQTAPVFHSPDSHNSRRSITWTRYFVVLCPITNSLNLYESDNGFTCQRSLALQSFNIYSNETICADNVPSLLKHTREVTSHSQYQPEMLNIMAQTLSYKPKGQYFRFDLTSQMESIAFMTDSYRDMLEWIGSISFALQNIIGNSPDTRILRIGESKTLSFQSIFQETLPSALAKSVVRGKMVYFDDRVSGQWINCYAILTRDNFHISLDYNPRQLPLYSSHIIPLDPFMVDVSSVLDITDSNNPPTAYPYMFQLSITNNSKFSRSIKLATNSDSTRNNWISTIANIMQSKLSQRSQNAVSVDYNRPTNLPQTLRVSLNQISLASILTPPITISRRLSSTKSSPTDENGMPDKAIPSPPPTPVRSRSSSIRVFGAAVKSRFMARTRVEENVLGIESTKYRKSLATWFSESSALARA